MRALVVFESMFGNTATIAEAVAEGISRHLPVEAAECGVAPRALTDDVVLLVVGGPTHAFSLSRPSTRQDAARQAEHGIVSTGIGLREWLEGFDAGRARAGTASFDTRVKVAGLPGSAAKAAAHRLRHRGLMPAAPAESFWVTGTTGPLVPGEVDRARRWGERLGAAVAARSAHAS